MKTSQNLKSKRMPSSGMKSSRMKSACTGGVLMLLAGCSSFSLSPTSLNLTESPTKAQDDVIVTELQGRPIAYVQEKLGLPNRRNDLPTGAMIWTYIDNEKGLNANQCKVALSIRDGVVQRVSIETKSESLFSAISTSCARIRKSLS